ncbi:hypothetical protein Cfla_2881 [Cellulomonas flavigena DSM 20109]|uniref:Uncharacterized protein n=1 Tax=Cellulomonas flavigena (strain ATCC 482 / DSM 20109 / BCRC 11376 / JCM 18109 / NBRC 3775 / NCIMB 8073 / NRS 134) TaxID=446466 RepID=D5UKA4_CELFN|nr:hypothetical protein [Cellulomonas flavigena]ADG75765.1 hypothetical protein Cfla_2881 [Cellulomonas flavigena DSM 20109]
MSTTGVEGRYRRRASVVVAAVVGLVVSGCGDGGSATTTAAPSPAAVVRADGAPVPSTALAVERELPFSAFAAAATRVLDGGEALGEAEFRAVEELVAACMKDEGWEYVPAEYREPEEQMTWRSGVVWMPVLPADRADAERFGYGTDDVEAGEAELAAMEEVDVNNAYLADLAPSAQEAYLESMGGASESDLGCHGQAVLEVVGAQPTTSDVSQTHREIVSQMQLVAAWGVDADPEGAALLEEWAQCMEDAGYDVRRPDDDLGVGWPGGPLQAFDLAIGTAVDGTTDPAHRDMPTTEIPIESRYLVGSDAEHAIAVADYDCRAGTDLVARYVDVLARVQADFVADHRDTLDELLAATSTD